MPTALRRALIAAALTLPLVSFAADRTVPVIFAKGATSSTVKGSVTGYDSVNYTLGAKVGQTMTVKLSGSANAYFNVFAPGSDAAIADAMQARSFNGKLPATGQYRIQVFQPRAQARRNETAAYSLRIDIPAGSK